MITITFQELAEVVGGRLLGVAATRFRGVNRDSRSPMPEALFVAIRGERHDGHDFLGPGLAAAGFLVEREAMDPRPQVVVTDTVEALGRLAQYWRGRASARVIALTGSNGKTTTKEMLRSILAEAGSVHATEGNLNNHIGVPLTLLAMPADADFAVIEMGANHAGEIGRLSRWARPDIALITNAGRAHLEGFGSLEGVARAKGEIYQGLPEQGGVAVINLDDRFAGYWLSLNRDRPSLGFSLLGRGEVQGSWEAPGRLEFSLRGEQRMVLLGAPGRHVAQNALAAAAAASAAGCEIDAIARGLERWRPVAGRLRSFRHVSGATVWDDTYNANPESLAAAIDVLSASRGTRVLVLGDMNELGEDAAAMHAEMGRRARDSGVDHLFATGTLAAAAAAAFGDGGCWFAARDELAAALAARLTETTTVLVKGSRAQHMEQVLAGIGIDAETTRKEAGDASGAR